MTVPTEAVCDVACSRHADRWHVTVIESPSPADDDLLTLLLTSIDDVAFATVDLIARRRGFRPQHLRLYGVNITGHFRGERRRRRIRQDGAGSWDESWAAMSHGDRVDVDLRSTYTP